MTGETKNKGGLQAENMKLVDSASETAIQRKKAKNSEKLILIEKKLVF